MTINNPDKYLEGVWDWSILKGCFGSTKIEPTDIDGFVERKGRFLVIEAKQPGVPIKQGQMWTFNALRNTRLFTIIIVWGEQNRPEEMQVLYPSPLQPGAKKRATISDLRKTVEWWFKYADQQK